MRWIALAIAAPWLAWAIGRTLGLDRVHPIIAFAAFTPYAAVTSPLPLLVALVLRRWLLAAACAVAVGLFALAVLPRATGAPPPESERSGRAAVTVMASNLFAGGADPAALVALARRERVDVLVLVEADAATVARVDAAGARALYPHRVIDARNEPPGTAVLSRHPVSPVGRTDAGGVSRATADVAVPGRRDVRVVAIHPKPPLSRTSTRLWREFLARLPDGDAAAPKATVLAGDFNATLDHRDLRRVLDRGYRDAAAETGEGLRPTWPVGRRIFPITIDHVLASDGVAVRRYAAHTLPGTDHRAVVAELVLGGR